MHSTWVVACSVESVGCSDELINQHPRIQTQIIQPLAYRPNNQLIYIKSKPDRPLACRAGLRETLYEYVISDVRAINAKARNEKVRVYVLTRVVSCCRTGPLRRVRCI